MKMNDSLPKKRTVAFARLRPSAGTESTALFVATLNKSLLIIDDDLEEWNSSGIDLYAVGKSEEAIYSEFETTMKKRGGEIGLPVKIVPAGDKMNPKDRGLSVIRDKTIPGANTLHAVLASQKSRPDFTVTYCGMPVMIMELQSPCEYWHAIQQICFYLFDHFRYVPNISATFKEWSGYLYAKAAQDHNECSKKKVNGCVTRVDIKWLDEELAFEVTFEPLKLDEYKADMKKHLQKQIDNLRSHKVAEMPPLLLGIPLSEESITFINTQIADAIHLDAADNPNAKSRNCHCH